MKSVFEIIKENGQWEKFKDIIKNKYKHKEIQEEHLKNMQKFLNQIQIHESWNVEFISSDNIFGDYIFIDVIIKNEKAEYVFHFDTELNTFEGNCRFIIHEITMSFNNWRVILENNLLGRDEGKIDFSKLLTEYNELAKMLGEAVK